MVRGLKGWLGGGGREEGCLVGGSVWFVQRRDCWCRGGMVGVGEGWLM
jgi:hypothetical protein